MKTTVSQPESWQRVLNIEVPDEDVSSAFNEKLKQYKREIKLPGFRQGKVPANIIRTRYGAAIRAEVVEDLVQQSYQQALRENKITPVSQGKISDLNAPEGQPLTFTVEAEVDPEIEIKGYDKLKVKMSPKKVKDADVDKAVEELRERMAELVDVDRPSKEGDMLTIEYKKVVVDGEEKSDVQNPQYPIELGKSRLKEVDKELTGHRAGDVVDVTAEFPKDSADSSLAGKTTEMQILITKVQEQKLPEINEEFLKRLGDFDSEEALRKHMREDMERRELESAKNEAYNEAVEKLIKKNPFDVPPARVQQYIDYVLEEMQRRNPGQPQPPREEVEQRYHEDGVRMIKRQRIIDYVASKENIKPTQEDVDAEIRQIAQMYNQPFDDLKQAFRRNGTTNRIRSDLREKKTLDYLIGEYQPPKE